MSKIEAVGVVGCGVMGQGIAQVCALHGFDVKLADLDHALAAKGLASIEDRLARDVERGRLAPEALELAKNRLTVASVDGLWDRDLVIEAIVEAIGPKRDLFKQLGAVCKPDAVLASNTSSLPISELAAASGRVSSVVGLHFFNPPSALKLLELTTTPETDPAKVEAIEAFCAAIERDVVRVQDTPGFIVNRLLIPFIFDAIRLAESGVAEAAAVDLACKSGLGHAMGPLATADLIGLDTLAQIGDALFQDYGEPRFKPPVALRRLISLGHLGRKSGRGFFEYGKG